MERGFLREQNRVMDRVLADHPDGETLRQLNAGEAVWNTSGFKPGIGQVSGASLIFREHANFRNEWREWFIMPARFDTAMFVLQELGEVSDALRLNSGEYARNRGGQHKATSEDVNKELADLFLMVHTLYMKVGNERVNLRQQFEKYAGGGWEFECLAHKVTNMVRLAIGTYIDPNGVIVTGHCADILAYILAAPEWNVEEECRAVLAKWEKRAKGRAMLAYAEELGFECKLKMAV